MARRTPPTANQTATEQPEDGTPEGGGLGVIPEALTELSYPGQIGANPPPDVSHIRPTRYTIEKGGFIMYAGAKTKIHEGNIISDQTHDIALLQRQGIVLKAIDDAPPVAEA